MPFSSSMLRQLTADEVSLYMLKKALEFQCVEFKLEKISYISLDSLRTRLYQNKRGNSDYDTMRVAVAKYFVTVVNIAIMGESEPFIVEQADVEGTLPLKPVKPAKTSVNSPSPKQPIGEAELGAQFEKLDMESIRAIRVLIEKGVISSFLVLGCDAMLFNSIYANAGFVVKETQRGVALF